MRKCEDCGAEAPPGERTPLCYDCLYMRYVAYKAENKKNFKLLCQTEERLAYQLAVEHWN